MGVVISRGVGWDIFVWLGLSDGAFFTLGIFAMKSVNAPGGFIIRASGEDVETP